MIGGKNKLAITLADKVLPILREEYSYPELSLLLHNFSRKWRAYKAIKITPSYKITLTGEDIAGGVFDFLRNLYILINEIDEQTGRKMRQVVREFSETTDAVLSFLHDEINNIVSQYTEAEVKRVFENAGEDFLAMRFFAILCSALLIDTQPDDEVFSRIRDLQLVDENIGAITVKPGTVRYERVLKGDLFATFNRILTEILKYCEKEAIEKKRTFFKLVNSVLVQNGKLAQSIRAADLLLKGCLAEKIKIDVVGIERIVESGMFPRHGIITLKTERLGDGICFANAIAGSILSRYGAITIGVSSISIEEYIDISALQFDAEEIGKSVFIDWYTCKHKSVESLTQEGRVITCASNPIALEMGINRAINSMEHSPLRGILLELSPAGTMESEFANFMDTIKTLAYTKDVLFILVTPIETPKSFDAKIADISDGMFEIRSKGGSTQIKAIHVKWEEPDYTEYILTIEGRKIEIGVRKKKKKEISLEEELGLGEEDPIEKYRKRLGRTFNYRIVEDEFLLCLRVPRESVEDLTDEDIGAIASRLKRENIENLKEKILSVYFICDRDYVETDIHRFMDALTMRRASPILRAAEEIKKLRIGERDPVIRKLLDELSRTGARVSARLRHGSKAAEVTTTSGRGRVVGYKQAGENPQDIALLPTIRVAAAKGRRGRGTFVVEIKKEDFQEKIRKTRTPVYLCFVVDTSGYEEPEIRGKIVSSLVISMLKDAYERRDQVALVTYSGNHATVLCNFTTDVEYVGACMKKVEFGGLTPLGSALLTGLNLLHAKVGDRLGVVPILIVLTTGTANVPVTPGGNIRRELLSICRLIWNSNYKVLVIDISERGSNLAREIALLTGGRYYHPQNLRYQKLALTRSLLDALRTKDVKSAIEASKKFLRES